jgi:hypothetical protein
METVSMKCRCGRVQLHISAPAIAQFYCHCDDCQATSGGAYVPVALFSSDSVTVIGDTFTWTYKTLPRTRCSACGTFLFGEPPGLGFRGVSGWLLAAGSFRPAHHIQCRYAVAPVKDDLPHFKSLPAGLGGTDETVDW